jgi:hypothetical protein
MLPESRNMLNAEAARWLFPTNAIHRTGVDRFLDQLFGSACGIVDFRQIVVIHAEHPGGGGDAELATYADILVNVRFIRHGFLLLVRWPQSAWIIVYDIFLCASRRVKKVAG